MTVTFVARIFDDFPASLTSRTRLLHREEALTHLYLACTVTGRTGDRRAAGFRTAAVANITFGKRWNADLFGDTTNGLFQSQIHIVAQIRTPAGALTATTTEDVAKDVTKDVAEICTAATAIPTTAAHTALFKSSMTVLVVSGTFLRIGQNFVRFFDLFKFGFGIFITLVTVRVMLHRQAFIRLFDFALIGRFSNAQKLVIILLRHTFSSPQHACTGAEFPRRPCWFSVIDSYCARLRAIISCL